VFKRSDFLCFDVASIQSEGNLQLYQYLDPNSGEPHPFSHLELEVWESWREYPKIPEIKDLTKRKGLELLAWLVHTFGQRLYLSRLTERERKVFWNNPNDNLNNILDLLTLDDLIFIFVQVENNINKWNLMYSAWKAEYIEGWKANELILDCECMNKIKEINKCGYEFPPGHSVAKECKHWYNEITKYFYDAYFAEDEASFCNKEALETAINKLVEKSQATRNKDTADADEMDLLLVTEISSSDAVLDAIQASMWTSNFLDTTG
jgi:hypothetical protein